VRTGYEFFARVVIAVIAAIGVASGGTVRAAPGESFYLTGGTVISMVPDEQPYKATVLVKDGRIAAIARRASLSAQDLVVDISGRYLLPVSSTCMLTLLSYATRLPGRIILATIVDERIGVA
jgi:hypothetical protein